MEKKISLKEAISIGVGGMVGGGIFAVLGLAVSLGKGGTPIAFLFAGIITLITSYSYVKLSLKFPDKGGTVKFINKGFGRGVFSGAINNILWISYIITLSLYASAFGSYAPNFFNFFENASFAFHFYSSLIIIIATFINYYSLKTVGKIESFSVALKLIILLSFVFIGLYGLIGNPNVQQLSIEQWEPALNLLIAGMVIFIAYEGFELIANAAPDIINPEKNIPKAYYITVIFVIILYVLISIITVGSLPFTEIAKAEEYVLAEAAKPILGKAGFIIITFAALISTFSAINATLFGGSRVSFEIAKEDELPHALTGMLWNQPIGLFITAVGTILITNLLNLQSISLAASVGFLLVFGLVNLSNYKLHKQTNSNIIIPILGFILCTIALIVLLVQQYATNKIGVLLSVGVILFSFIFEFFFKKTKKKVN